MQAGRDRARRDRRHPARDVPGQQGRPVVICVDKHAAVLAELESWSNQAQAGCRRQRRRPCRRPRLRPRVGGRLISRTPGPQQPDADAVDGPVAGGEHRHGRALLHAHERAVARGTAVCARAWRRPSPWRRTHPRHWSSRRPAADLGRVVRTASTEASPWAGPAGRRGTAAASVAVDSQGAGPRESVEVPGRGVLLAAPVVHQPAPPAGASSSRRVRAVGRSGRLHQVVEAGASPGRERVSEQARAEVGVRPGGPWAGARSQCGESSVGRGRGRRTGRGGEGARVSTGSEGSGAGPTCGWPAARGWRHPLVRPEVGHELIDTVVELE